MANQILLSSPINVSSNGDNLILSPSAKQRIRVLNFVMIPAALVTVTIYDGASAGNLILAGPFALTTQGIWPGWAPFWSAGTLLGHFETATLGNKLNIFLSSGVQVGGYVNYLLLMD